MIACFNSTLKNQAFLSMHTDFFEYTFILSLFQCKHTAVIRKWYVVWKYIQYMQCGVLDTEHFVFGYQFTHITNRDETLQTLLKRSTDVHRRELYKPFKIH